MAVARDLPGTSRPAGTTASDVAVAFSPNGQADALLKAHKRDVRVRLVADRRNNLVDDGSGKARAALQAVAHAGVDVRTSDAYAIGHDQAIVADRRHVQTGSFHDSAAAQSRKAENLLVLLGRPDAAKQYLWHVVRNHQGVQALVGRY
ncbi:phospholipase D-like domain-containing protein [Sphaerotilus mobilis]|uniref:phospholipase D-like domain-containing protein n=1 Tax=Sphaerotilus mobilis TaxID=47994 RepID=UPI001A91F2BF|nr:phospholipase D-like domain-containing protein [Sphaerotilus mobilis]